MDQTSSYVQYRWTFVNPASPTRTALIMLKYQTSTRLPNHAGVYGLLLSSANVGREPKKRSGTHDERV